MKYQVRHAAREDLDRLEQIYARARIFMAQTGNPTQWKKGYPSREKLQEDLKKKSLYVICQGDQIHGVFFFALGEDPTYRRIEDGAWHSGSPYGTIHRIAGDGSGGILKAAVAFALIHTDYLRIDTHENNCVMQGALGKLGFRRCGRIYIEDGSERIAYDLMK